MFNEENVKYTYLKDSIDSIRTRHEKTDAWRYNGKTVLREFNVIALGGARQSGKTLAIKEMFRPTKDVYVSYTIHAVEDFLSDNVDITSGEATFIWYDSDKKFIRARDAALSIRATKFMDRLKAAIVEDSVIYLDLESISVPGNHIYIEEIINMIEEEFNDDALAQKIVVYT